MPGDTSRRPALAFPGAACHKGPVRRLRDFASINDFLSDREIDELQAAIDARRGAHVPEARLTVGAGCNDAGPPARPTAQGGDESGERTERGERMGLLGGSGKNDKDEGAMDKAKGRAKEAGGSLTGDRKLKREGSSDQRKGRAKQKKGDLKDLLK